MMTDAARFSMSWRNGPRMARRSLAAIGIEVWRASSAMRVEVVEADRLLEPGRPVGLQRLGDA